MKFIATCALAIAAANAQYYGRSYSAPSYGYKQASYGYAAPSYGYGDSYGNTYRRTRLSTIRPRDVVAYSIADKYWKDAPKADEQLMASCTFDFLGYSHSSGQIEFTQEVGDRPQMIGSFKNVKPGQHALKIHEFGDLSDGCESTGDVFNPFGAKHGHSHFDIHDRRVGDIEQVQVRWDTDAEYKTRDLLVTLDGPNSVIGRAMVMYEREDDFDQTEHPPTNEREGRYRTGMGRRIGCCVIGLARPVVEEDEPVVMKEEPVYRQGGHYGGFGHDDHYGGFGHDDHYGGFGGYGQFGGYF